MGENMDFKERYEKIDIPSELDLTIEKAINRGKREKRSRILRPAAAAAVLIAAFIFTVNVSPAFAHYLENVPGLSYLVNLVKFDKGLTMAVENGCIQKIDKYAEDKGIKFTVDNVILDRKRMIISYTIESKDNYEGLIPHNVSVTGGNGEKISALLSYGSPDNSSFDKDGKARGIIDIQYPGDSNETFPEEIVLNIKSFYEQPLTDQNLIEGNWSVDFKLDKVLISVSPKVINAQMEFTLGQMKFNVDYVKVYPTIIEMKVSADKGNSYRFTGFKDLYLEDEKGNRYTCHGSTFPDGETVLNFESNYYIDAKELYLNGSGVFLMPREDQYLVIDLDSKKVTEDGGYGIECLYDRKDELWNDRVYDFTIAFKINDTEIAQNGRFINGSGIGLDTMAFDENNNAYTIGGNFSAVNSNDMDTEFGFLIEKMDKIPHTLKIKIDSVAKGIMEPFRIRLY